MLQVGLSYVDFGFGPAGKAVVLAGQLLQRGCEVHVFGHARAHRLFDSIARSSTGAFRLEQTLSPRLTSRLDAFISVLDEAIEKTLFRPATRLLYVDSLSWMWDRIPTAFLSGDAYVAQNFFGVPDRIQALTSEGIAAFVVGPIVDPAQNWRRHEEGSSSLLLTFGGLSDPISTAKAQAETVQWILSGIRRTLEHEATVICVPSDCQPYLSETPMPPSWTLCELSHQRFLRQLRRSRAVIGLPGLTTILESAAAGVPFIPLLPNNYSQALIFRTGVEMGLFPGTMIYRTLLSRGALIAGQSELAGVRGIKAALGDLMRDSQPSNIWEEYPALLLPDPLDELAASQRRWFESLGPNGALAIATLISGGR